jgi:hypothetical protein
MEYTIALLQYSLVLAVILSTIYTAFFYREVYAKGAVISRFIGIFFFSSVLFLLLNKVVGWDPLVVYHKTIKFVLILCAVFTVVHVLVTLSRVNLTGLPLLSFIVLLMIAIAFLLAFTGLAG